MRSVVFIGGLVVIAACTSSSLDGFSSGGGPADGGAGPVLVRCPDTACTPDAPLCCGEGLDGSVYKKFSCREAGACGAKGLVLPCRSSADCAAAGAPAGSVCCAFRSGSSTDRVECTARSSCLGEKENRLVCDHRSPECEAPQVCTDDGTSYVAFETCHLPK